MSLYWEKDLADSAPEKATDILWDAAVKKVAVKAVLGQMPYANYPRVLDHHIRAYIAELEKRGYSFDAILAEANARLSRNLNTRKGAS